MAAEPRARTGDFDRSQDLERTHTSNAIEGNTLTAIETTMVIEQGLTVAGKPLKYHREAVDHFEASRYVCDLARQQVALSAMDAGNLHRLVRLRSDPGIAGQYADQGRYVLTESGRHGFPSPAEIPGLMGGFFGLAWRGGGHAGDGFCGPSATGGYSSV